MPSKHSERLKQAIEYIRSGEKEIAREIILEIIQNDPDYEKAWIWLVETVPDRENKIDILKTRLEQYPETSPFSRIALDKIAPEVLDTLIPASEAIIYPEGMEPRSEATEDEIQYNVTVEDNEEQFRLEEEDLIQFEEPEDSSPFETSDSDVFHQLQTSEADEESEDLFVEPPKEAPVEQDLDFNLFEDTEGEQLQQQDLDVLMAEEEKQPETPDIEDEFDEDFDAWLLEDEDQPRAESVDELADLLNDVAPLDEDGNVIVDENADDYGVFGITEDQEDTPAAAPSSPFILDEDSKQILGEEVVEKANIESQSLDELFRDATTDELTPTTGFLESPDFPLMEEEQSQPAAEISQEDINEASDNFRDSLMAESISQSDMRQRRMSQQMEQQKEEKKKKKKQKNATFVFGCSMVAAVLFFSLIALGYILLQQANNPVLIAVTLTPQPPTATATITPTVTLPAVAPWLDEEEETTELTLTPVDEEGEEEPDTVLTPGEMATGEGLSDMDLDGWVSLFESYAYECSLLEQSGDSLYQTCEYLDDDHDILVFLYGTEETMPTRIEYQVIAMQTEDLENTPALEAVLDTTVIPLVIFPLEEEYQQPAADWLREQSLKMVDNKRDDEGFQDFGELTLTLEYIDYFLRIEL